MFVNKSYCSSKPSSLGGSSEVMTMKTTLKIKELDAYVDMALEDYERLAQYYGYFDDTIVDLSVSGIFNYINNTRRDKSAKEYAREVKRLAYERVSNAQIEGQLRSDFVR